MIRKAFKMKVHPEKTAEYFRRHNPIWENLKTLLKGHGVHNYSIFLDSESGRRNGINSRFDLPHQSTYGSRIRRFLALTPFGCADVVFSYPFGQCSLFLTFRIPS